MPCQNAMESTPATLKISEKVRKYHFFPRKSMFVLRKNSKFQTPKFGFELQAGRFATSSRLIARS
jgi:hypothetical protein